MTVARVMQCRSNTVQQPSEERTRCVFMCVGAFGLPAVLRTLMYRVSPCTTQVPIRRGSVVFHHGSTIYRRTTAPPSALIYSAHWVADVALIDSTALSQSTPLRDRVAVDAALAVDAIWKFG